MAFKQLLQALSMIGCCLTVALAQNTPDGRVVCQVAAVPPVNLIDFDEGVGDTAWLTLSVPFGGLLVGNSPSISIRRVHIFNVATWEAYAALSDKSSGLIFGKRFKRPKAECTTANQKVAVYYSIYRTMTLLFPIEDLPLYRPTFQSLKLDPDDMSMDVSTPIGLGNKIGSELAEYFLHDGANQLGDLPDVKYNRVPYSDYTGYEPKNTWYRLRDPTRWQPLRVIEGANYSRIQEFAGVQIGSLPPNTFKSVKQCPIPTPKKSLNFKSPGYKKQAQRVLDLSASLNDTTKVLAFFFDDGGYLTHLVYLANKYKWNFAQMIRYRFATNIAAFDSVIAFTHWKRHYDTVRPISVIRNSGLFKKVKAWGGPGKGTVVMDAREWRQFAGTTASEPEYPSGLVAYVAALSEASRRLLGTDEFGWSPTVPAGISRVEPGVPKSPVTMHFPTFTSFIEQSQLAREYGGVHFRDATTGGKTLGECVARTGWPKILHLLDGKTYKHRGN